MGGLSKLDYTVGTNVIVAGNVVDIKNYHTYHAFTLNRTNWSPGDTVIVSLVIEDSERKVQLWWGGAAANPASETGLFVVSGSGMDLANSGDIGYDEISWTVPDTNADMFFDTINNDGATNINLKAKIRIINVYINGQPTMETDPYDESVEPSEPGGGDPTEDMYDSDDIDEPDDPEISAVSTGFISLWSPTEQQMLSLSAFMWNADFLTIDFWKKLIANPLDLIYGLNIVPMDLGDYIDGTGNVVVGLIDTHIQMNHLSTQWITVDCGSVNIEEAWGAYLDYDPFTKLEIYLPFCGTHPLKMDDFMPGSIHLTYKIDLVTGTCVALIKSTKSAKHDDTLNSIVYQFMGNCATQVPVTAAQYSDAVRSAISIAASIGSMVAVGAGGAAAAKAADTGKGLIGVKTVGAELNQAASLVENVMNLKPSIEKSGAIGSSGSLLAVRTPYLIFTRPRMARPQNQNVYTGYPSFITRTLGDLNGWTKVQAIHLENIPCTSEEMAEIDTLLQTGVIM